MSQSSEYVDGENADENKDRDVRMTQQYRVMSIILSYLTLMFVANKTPPLIG